MAFGLVKEAKSVASFLSYILIRLFELNQTFRIQYVNQIFEN